MSNDWPAFFCGLAFGVCLSVGIWVPIANNSWQRDAIRHGAAHYDKQSGAFTWNESEAK